MEVKFEAKNVTAAKKYGPRCQVVPVDVKRSELVKTSTASAFFVEKHHTKIKKAAKASPVLEVSESMQNDENTALLNTLPDCLALADTQVEGASKLIENATIVFYCIGHFKRDFLIYSCSSCSSYNRHKRSFSFH